MPIRIYIQPDLQQENMIRYVFGLIAINRQIEFQFIADQINADLKITADSSGDFHVSKAFYEKISNGIFKSGEFFRDTCVIRNENDEEDLLSTIFYCVNSIQEYNHEGKDQQGRFPYNESYQYRFNNVKENIVQRMIDKVCSNKNLHAAVKPPRRSKIFLTHDIDSIHGAWKEDSFHALKNFRPGKVFSLMLNEALGKPDWLNMDRIMKIEDEHGFRSVFYWLLYKDKKNADYDFSSGNVQKHFRRIQNSEWENGLHKSLRHTSFREELMRMPAPVKGNRYHYLNFKLPSGYSEIEKSELMLDTSLGFSGQWGFRNSYGLPFMPFNLKEKRVYNFIEVPMQIMDRTFFSRRIPVNEIKKELLEWFEKNKYDCVFSINFHNNFFSGLKYDGYIELYKSLLEYFKESGFEPATQSDLVKEFYDPRKFNLN
jgi:hypothetical protein